MQIVRPYDLAMHDNQGTDHESLRKELAALRAETNRRKWEDDALRSIVSGVLAATGEHFFRSLVLHLADLFKVEFVYIAELLRESESILQTLASCAHGRIERNYHFDFTGTPCESVVGKSLCLYPERVSEKFPADHWLSENKIESYIGIPLRHSSGSPLGIIAMLGTAPIPNPDMAESLLQIFAPLVSAEIEREHAQRSLADSEMRFRELLEAVFEGVLIYVEDRIVETNPALATMFGYSEQELVGRSILDLIAPEYHDEFSRCQGDREDMPCEFHAVRKDGSGFFIEAVRRWTGYGDRRARVMAVRDITERKTAEQWATYMATHDPLTALPNRTMFYDRLQQALRQNERTGKSVALHYIDLIDFKNVNDTLGHAAGDEVLRNVAARLSECVRKSDTIARLGGDEFAVIQTNVVGPEQAALLAGRMLNAIGRVQRVSERQLSVSASIGISLSPQDSIDKDALILNADHAMYRAKRAKRGRYEFFDSALDVVRD